LFFGTDFEVFGGIKSNLRRISEKINEKTDEEMASKGLFKAFKGVDSTYRIYDMIRAKVVVS